MIEGFVMMTAGGLLSVVEPARRHLAWVRWSAALRNAFPAPPPSGPLDDLLDRIP